MKNIGVIGLFLILFVPFMLQAEEQNLQEQIAEVHKQMEAEQELNEQLKQDVESKDAELAGLKERLEALETELKSQEDDVETVN